MKYSVDSRILPMMLRHRVLEKSGLLDLSNPTQNLNAKYEEAIDNVKHLTERPQSVTLKKEFEQTKLSQPDR
jgi:hypothetical protein